MIVANCRVGVENVPSCPAVSATAARPCIVVPARRQVHVECKMNGSPSCVTDTTHRVRGLAGGRGSHPRAQSAHGRAAPWTAVRRAAGHALEGFPRLRRGRAARGVGPDVRLLPSGAALFWTHFCFGCCWLLKRMKCLLLLCTAGIDQDLLAPHHLLLSPRPASRPRSLLLLLLASLLACSFSAAELLASSRTTTGGDPSTSTTAAAAEEEAADAGAAAAPPAGGARRKGAKKNKSQRRKGAPAGSAVAAAAAAVTLMEEEDPSSAAGGLLLSSGDRGSTSSGGAGGISSNCQQAAAAASAPPPEQGGESDGNPGIQHRCGTCGAVSGADGEKLLLCSGCRRVRYCGAGCQRVAWKALGGGHKALCLAAQEQKARRRRKALRAAGKEILEAVQKPAGAGC